MGLCLSKKLKLPTMPKQEMRLSIKAVGAGLIISVLCVDSGHQHPAEMDLSRFFPPSLLDQGFGLCISPEDLIFPSYNFHRTNYYRPWKWYMQRAEKDFGSTIQNDKDRFKIALDVQHFLPEEIHVKVADREIIIEGTHEERQDSHGMISRKFKRRYILPPDCNADSVFSSLSSDGVLTISAEKIRELKNKEINVPIKMCETCPNKDLTNKEDKTKQIVEAIKKTETDTRKKGMEIMLKEDHCCLLRPELLGVSSGGEKTQYKKEKGEITTSVEKCESSTSNKTSGKIDINCGQASAVKTEKSGTCGQASTEISETETTAKVATTAGKTETAASQLTTAGIHEKITSGLTSTKTESAASSSISSGITEISAGMAIKDKKEKADALLCSLSSSGKSETVESLLSGASNAGRIESEAVACGITSEVITEKAATSASTMSEICNITSMLNETIQIHESSSSFSSSMAESIKETTEKISEIVSDISAQLKEAAENI